MEDQTISQPEKQEESKSNFKYFPFFNKKQPIFVLVLLGIIFYCTSLYNEYALDDGIVIHQNNYVLKGVAGIKDLMNRDLYDAFYRRMNAIDQLQGGRYHPLATISYAIEQEFIGPYRTGYYEFVQDINRNGTLDKGEVLQPDVSTTDKVSKNINTNVTKKPDAKEDRLTQKAQAQLNDYEYNDFVDKNGDGVAQQEECFTCWDKNKNFANDPSEDLNADGVFNEADCQVYRADLRHFNNIWLYVLGCVLLYLVFVKYIFKDNPDMAFLAALIFLAHPVHSEVIANVKGRDEILSLIFMSLTFLFSFKFMNNKKTSTLTVASIMFLLALLSKEFAIMLLLLIPIAMFVFNKIKIDVLPLTLLTICYLLVFFLMIAIKLMLVPAVPPIVMILSGVVVFMVLSVLLFRKTFFNKELNALMIGLFAFSLLYIGLRLNAVSIAAGVPDKELLNDPYLLANGEEKFATKIFVLLKYIVLAVFPKNLTCDYSYDSIPYRHYMDFGFILSLLLNLTLLILGIVLVIKRHVMGFAIITYFAFLLLVSNFIFAIGATMHEGFLFHASIGFAIAFSWLIVTGFDKLKNIPFFVRRSVLFVSMTLIIFLFGCKTWERNGDWKNDVTLFLKDVKTSPNSVLVLGNAGARWIDLADTREITGILEPGQDSTRYNDYNGTLVITDEELKESGLATKREVALNRGIEYLKHAVELHPRYVNGYLNLGLASYKLNDDWDAVFYWKMAEHLYPKNPYLELYYRVYSGVLKERAATAFNNGDLKNAALLNCYWTIIKPNDSEAWYCLGGVYFNQKRFSLAEKAWRKALEIDPNYDEVKKVMQSLPAK
jgi:protein O-mannosyl-transferase